MHCQVVKSSKKGQNCILFGTNFLRTRNRNLRSISKLNSFYNSLFFIKKSSFFAIYTLSQTYSIIFSICLFTQTNSSTFAIFVLIQINAIMPGVCLFIQNSSSTFTVLTNSSMFGYFLILSLGEKRRIHLKHPKTHCQIVKKIKKGKS